MCKTRLLKIKTAKGFSVCLLEACCVHGNLFGDTWASKPQNFCKLGSSDDAPPAPPPIPSFVVHLMGSHTWVWEDSPEGLAAPGRIQLHKK